MNNDITITTKLIEEISSTENFSQRLFILGGASGNRLSLRKNIDTDLTKQDGINFHDKYQLIKSYPLAYMTAVEAIKVFEAILLSNMSDYYKYIPREINVYVQLLNTKTNQLGKNYYEYGQGILIKRLKKQAYSNSPPFWS